jgi:hypothetical protein
VKRILYVSGLLVLLVFITGATIVVPRVKRMLHGATGGIVGWDMSDALLGAAQFEGEHRAVFFTRFHRDKEEFFRLGVLDLGTGQVVSQRVLEDRGVHYLGQSERVAWIGGSGDGVRAIDESGAVVLTEKNLLKKDPQIGGTSLLSRLDDGAYVDTASGGLFLPRSGSAFLIDGKTFDAKPASASSVHRQLVSGGLPIASLTTGEMLTSAASGPYLALNGKQVVSDPHARMYEMKYLMTSRTGSLIELSNPRSVLVLYDDWDNSNPHVRVSRVAIDGRVLWTTDVRDVSALRKEQLKVVSTAIDRNNVVLFLDDYYAAAKYQPPVFTPCYAMAIDVANGRVAYTTHL